MAITGSAMTRPISCITINSGTDSGAIPANESVKLPAIVTAGLVSDVDEVNQDDQHANGEWHVVGRVIFETLLRKKTHLVIWGAPSSEHTSYYD